MKKDEEIVSFQWVKSVFQRSTVLANTDVEMFFYQWAWNVVVKKLNVVDLNQATVDALTLVHVCHELIYYVSGENFYDDDWDSVCDCFEDELLVIEPMELGFMCGRIAEDGDESPSDEKEALHWLIRNNHSRIVSALNSVDEIDLLTAVWASMGHTVRNTYDESGNVSGEEEMIKTYEDFCRYVSDDEFRADDVAGAAMADVEAAYEWWTNGAEMLKAES